MLGLARNSKICELSRNFTQQQWRRFQSTPKKRVVAAVCVLGSGSAALFVSLRDKVIDEKLPEKPFGVIYNFEEKISDTLPLDYNVPQIEAYWNKRPLEVLKRTTQIISVMGPYFAKLFLWEFLIRRKIRNHEGLQKKYAIILRERLTELGPCFIKFGQALSIRPDLLPPPFLFELQKLCDSVPSFPTKDAIAVIEADLGPGAASRLFEDLTPSTEPIAAASLGQVYKLRLKRESQKVGETSSKSWCRCSKACRVEDEQVVAVKVQRPDMLAYVLRDLYILRNIAKVIDKVKKVITNHRPYDVNLLDSFACASLKELDYINESENQEHFRRELLHRMGSKVYVPAVHGQLTTRNVLVSEWIEGQQLAKSEPEVMDKLTPVGVECFLIQLLEIGRFHADPHPGNLLVTPTNRLALIDFGLCADVPLPDTRTLTLSIVHLMQGDLSGLLGDAINLGFLPEDVNKEKLLPALQKIYDGAQIAMQEEARIKAVNKAKYKAIVTRRKRFMAVSNDLNWVFFTYPFSVPDYFALITRAMIVLEGIAVTGNPEFDLFQSAYPYAFRRAISLFGVSNLSEIAMEAVKSMRS